MTIDEAYNTCFGKPYIVPIDKHEEAKSIIKKSLDEIRQYRELGTVEECRNSVLNIPKAYNKAIDDLLEDANEMAIEVDTGTYTMKAIGIGLLEQIAEQLKAGGTNGNSTTDN